MLLTGPRRSTSDISLPRLDSLSSLLATKVCTGSYVSSPTKLVGLPASDLALASERVLDELTRLNNNIAWALAHDVFRKPTFRLVRSGTFSDFRQLKLDEGGNNLGQVKVPVVLPKAVYVTWFSGRVVQEL